jgi:hypothetical protein
MHLTYADKSLLVGDDVAKALIEYAAALATARVGDSVTVKAFGLDGEAVEAVLLLDTGAPIMAESTKSDLTEPDNTDVYAYMREKTLDLTPPRPAPTQDPQDLEVGPEQFD